MAVTNQITRYTLPLHNEDDRELLEWIHAKARAERRNPIDQILHMLEQLKRAEEAAAGHDPA